MKKNLKQALQAAGFVALFALAINSFPSKVYAEGDEEEQQVVTGEEVVVDDVTEEHENVTEPVVTVAENHDVVIENIAALPEAPDNAPKEVKEKTKKKLGGYLHKALAQLEKAPNSLRASFDKIKGDAAVATPKAVKDIEALNHTDQRFELYKIRAATTTGDITPEAFKKLIDNLVDSTKEELRLTRELLIGLILDKDFKLMSDKEIKAALKELNPQHSGRKGKHHKSPKRKHGKGKDKKDKDNKGKDKKDKDRDNKGKGKGKDKKDKAGKKNKGKGKGKDRDNKDK